MFLALILLLVSLSPVALMAQSLRAEPLRVQSLPDTPRPKGDLMQHIALTAAGVTFAMLDSHSTRIVISNGGRELDPLERAFARSNALYVQEATWSLGLGFLGWKMHHSHNRVFRQLWWLPQSIQLEGNLNSWRHNNRVIARDLSRSVPGKSASSR